MRSFKACGISNKLGGSEDSLVRSIPETEGACDSDDDTDDLDYNNDDDTPLAVLIAREIEGMAQ